MDMKAPVGHAWHPKPGYQASAPLCIKVSYTSGSVNNLKSCNSFVEV